MVTVLVTGGSTGIGKAICKEFNLVGYEVINAAMEPEDTKMGDSLDYSSRLRYAHCDVTDTATLMGVIRGNKPDILVNNAGILPLTDFLLQTWSEMKRIIDTNLMAPIIAANLAIDEFIDNPKEYPRGRLDIINIASMSGYYPDPDTPTYGASKAGLINFTQSIAGAYNTKNVFCNCICPGLVDTKLCDGEAPDEILNLMPGGPFRTNEVSELVYWLTTSQLNGAVLPFDKAVNHSFHSWNKIFIKGK